MHRKGTERQKYLQTDYKFIQRVHIRLKLPLGLIKYRNMKSYGGMELWLHAVLT